MATSVGELLEKLAEHRAHIEAAGTLAARRRRNLRSEVLAIATLRLRRELEAAIADDPAFAQLLERVVSRELDPARRGPRDSGVAARVSCSSSAARRSLS